MSCIDVLLSKLDNAAENVEFPLWQCGEVGAVIGAMRASGFSCDLGAALVIEQIEFAMAEGFIQCSAFCLATFPIKNLTFVGEGVLVNVRKSEQDDFPFTFGDVEIHCRNRKFTIRLDREELMSNGYLDFSQDTLTTEALLFKICDKIPRDWLFSEELFLKQLYAMPADASRCFVVENWEHPSFDQIYADAVIPSSCPDLRAMVEAACVGKEHPKLIGTSTTNWREQCR